MKNKTYMKNKIEAVKTFHTAFKIGHRETPKADLGLSKTCCATN